MRKFFLFSLFSLAVFAFAQPAKKGKESKMVATLSKGYYVNLKGDTIRGEVANENPLDVYKGFSFKIGAGKVLPITSKKAKAYGFEGRHFTFVPIDGTDGLYLEYLVKGRVNFLEIQYPDTKAGEPVISSKYYIQDTRPEEKDAELKTLKQISEKFYKKDLKPYLKDQIMVWDDLDKFVFNKEAVLNAIKEFNKFYETTTE